MFGCLSERTIDIIITFSASARAPFAVCRSVRALDLRRQQTSGGAAPTFAAIDSAAAAAAAVSLGCVNARTLGLTALTDLIGFVDRANDDAAAAEDAAAEEKHDLMGAASIVFQSTHSFGAAYLRAAAPAAAESPK